MAGFQSFAERYIIERASTFKAGREKEDAWTALQDAKTIFGMIKTADPERVPMVPDETVEMTQGEMAALAAGASPYVMPLTRPVREHSYYEGKRVKLKPEWKKGRR